MKVVKKGKKVETSVMTGTCNKCEAEVEAFPHEMDQSFFMNCEIRGIGYCPECGIPIAFEPKRLPMNRIDQLQHDIGKFSDETFGKGRLEGTLAHLKKEIQEIIDNPTDEMEYADALLLLLDAARKVGYSATYIMLMAERKIEINKARTWQEPNEDGSVEHVRGEEDE